MALLSPYSIQAALAMTYACAASDTPRRDGQGAALSGGRGLAELSVSCYELLLIPTKMVCGRVCHPFVTRLSPVIVVGDPPPQV